MTQVSSGLKDFLKLANQGAAIFHGAGCRPTSANAREALGNLTRSFVTEPVVIPKVLDDLIPAATFPVPVRIYHPRPETRLPVALFVHGGGHMAGSIAVYDPIARRIAAHTSHILVSVEYRRAPESPYPAGLTDVMAAAKGIWACLDRFAIAHEKSLSLIGDSGGGAFCASLSHLAQYDPAISFQKQVLIYPSLDYTLQLPSTTENATGYLLETDKVGWYFDNYFQQAEDRKKASPLFMETDGNMPRTLVITAGFCPLRDEGIAYCEKLKAKGISACNHHFPTMIHGYLNLENLVKEECRKTYEIIGAFLSDAPPSP